MPFQKGYTPWNKGLTVNEDKRIARPWLGEKFSEKTKKEMSKAQLKRKEKDGYINSPETREKIRKAERGIHNSPGTEFKTGHRVPEAWRTSWSERNKKLLGEKALNWQGGKTSEDERIRKSERYKEWRRRVFERDNFTCQECGRTDCYLEAHHILSFRDFPELRFDLLNGVTLCLECHNKTKQGRTKISVGANCAV